MVLCFATVGLLISSDVNLFIFNSLDSIKKRDTIWTIKEATVPDVVLKCVDEDLGVRAFLWTKLKKFKDLKLRNIFWRF